MPEKISDSGYLDSINAFRGFGAFAVLLYHLQLQLTPFHLFIACIPRGYLAVDMFFAISGFVITHVYLKQFQSLNFKEYGQFILNRLIRIYPVHLATLLCLFLLEVSRVVMHSHSNGLNPPFTQSTSFPALLSNLLLIQAWHIHPFLTWNFPAWSISSEWFVYLLAPLIVWYCGKIRHSIARATLLFCISAALMGILNHALGRFDITYDFGPLRTLFGFCMGASLYVVYMNLRQKTLSIRYDWIAVSLIALSFLLSSLHSIPDMLPFLLNPFVLLACVLSTGWLYRVLTNKALFYAGEISYSLYMTHGIVINQCFNFFNRFVHHPTAIQIILIVPVIVLLSFLVAHFTYVYIENPARIFFKKRLSKPINIQVSARMLNKPIVISDPM